MYQTRSKTSIKMRLSSVFCISLLTRAIDALDNGFGRLPLMGYNTYNDASCTINETFARGRVDDMVSSGLAELGYKYFQLDCGWQGFDRLSNGSITYDAAAFPNGIRPLSNYARSKGLRWSMYTDQGVYACDTISRHRPGSLGYEKQDALSFAAWNTEYVKVDNCWITPDANAPKDPRDDFPSRYSAMSTALQNVGIKGIMVCQWGTPYSSPSGLQGPAQWTPPLANSFRVSDDIAQGWGNVMRIMNQAIQVNLKNQSAPGRWADLDLLEVGNPGMTVSEQATHFALWAIFKSPLFVSTNVNRMSSDTQNILKNRDIVAVNQDSLAVPATLYQRFTDDYDIYMGPLANGDRVVMLFDQTNTARTLSVTFSTLGIKSATVKDLWSKSVTNGASSFSKNIGAHDQILLRLSNIVFTGAALPKRTFYVASSGTLSGQAQKAGCSGCSSGQKVGYLGAGDSVTISNVKASQGTQDVLFDYINCEVGYLYPSGGTNTRYASISVNGGAAQLVSFPLTGYNWDKDLITGYRVRLSGFSTTGPNTIRISGSNYGWAPDMDRISVVA